VSLAKGVLLVYLLVHAAYAVVHLALDADRWRTDRDVATAAVAAVLLGLLFGGLFAALAYA
jgi:hypothetical protein